MAILVLGGTGFLGKNLQSVLEDLKPELQEDVLLMGTSSANVYNHRTKVFQHIDGNSDSPFNLLDMTQCINLFDAIKPTRVLHLAGMSGGILANSGRTGDFYRVNTIINTNVLEVARLKKVDNLISILSPSIYPGNLYKGVTEKYLHKGPPHESHLGYANAKRMLEVQSRAYREQYGCNFKCVCPTNLYGKNDNFNMDSGHAIPSIIHKIYKAKLDNKESVELLGTGDELRQFTYAKDLAKILWNILINNWEFDTLNIGCSEEHKISEIAETIAKIVNYSGKIVYSQQNSGIARRQLNTKKFEKLNNGPFDWVLVKNGLNVVCESFINNYKSKEI